MINTLYLPELREMLAEQDAAGLAEFCVALHPARTAEFMEGLTTEECWRVLAHTDTATQVEIFGYLGLDRQIEMIETLDRTEVARFISELPPDDRVDLLGKVNPEVRAQLLPLIPAVERHDILRLEAYPEGTAGAVMTTEVARLSESMTVGQALESVRRQVEESETIYYAYVVDEENHLRGLVSLRQLVLAKSATPVSELMRRDVISVDVTTDQEEVAHEIARYDFLAIPVVDTEHHLLGIVTHDDVMDVVHEEATEDVHRIGGVAPLDVGYLETALSSMTLKRGGWLTFFFFGALVTAVFLGRYEATLTAQPWLVFFLPLVISSGGNTGSQSATLIVRALATGDLTLRDSWRILRRELFMGLLLGGFLSGIGLLAAALMMRVLYPTRAFDIQHVSVIPATLIAIVVCGALTGSLLPLLFRRFNLDPALMSTPLVAMINDMVGVLIYFEIAKLLVP